MDLIDIDIEDGGEGRDEIEKETDIEGEDFHSKLQTKQCSSGDRKPDKHILKRPQSQVCRFRTNISIR